MCAFSLPWYLAWFAEKLLSCLGVVTSVAFMEPLWKKDIGFPTTKVY